MYLGASTLGDAAIGLFIVLLIAIPTAFVMFVAWVITRTVRATNRRADRREARRVNP
jgi:hypothetical protein